MCFSLSPLCSIELIAQNGGEICFFFLANDNVGSKTERQETKPKLQQVSTRDKRGQQG